MDAIEAILLTLMYSAELRFCCFNMQEIYAFIATSSLVLIHNLLQLPYIN